MHPSSYNIIIICVDESTVSTPSATHFTSIFKIQEGTSRHNYIQEKRCFLSYWMTSN